MKRDTALRRKTERALMVFAFALASAGCERFNTSQTDTYRIPWPTEGGAYALSDVKVASFTRPAKLQGEHVRILVEPRARDGELKSLTPVGRFARTSGGAMVPADYASLQAAVIHAHFERLREIDSATGADQFVEWPVSIGIDANVNAGGARIRDNALYEKKLNSLLIVPFSSETSLPIALNAGVLAHEHFHLIFQSTVLAKLGDPSAAARLGEWAGTKPSSGAGDGVSGGAGAVAGAVTNEAYNFFLLRALNEGLADFWGWVYSGDVKFIGRSVPHESEPRRLDLKVGRLPTAEVLKAVMRAPNGSLRSEGERVLSSYRLGSEYARFLYSLAVENGGATRESRLAIAGALVRALPMLAAEAERAFAEDRALSPNFLFKPLTLQLAGKSCVLFASFAAVEPNSTAKPVVCE